VPDDIDCIDILWLWGRQSEEVESAAVAPTRTTAGGSLVEHHHGDRQAVQAVIHGLHCQANVLAADAT
jgi:hypothetical protein